VPDERVDFQRAAWRLLDTGDAEGAMNMAIDEAILLSVSSNRSPPTLRFYGWQPPCVSVGRAQSPEREIDLAACRRQGYTWVRRPTGGRAILHIDELTYSVTAPEGEQRVTGDIVTSYRRLSLGLVAGLRLVGCDIAQAGLQPDASQADKSAACFDVPSHYEVTAKNRKLVGSAQVRRKGVVLQHGALPLCGDVSRLADVLALSLAERAELKTKLQNRAITLEEALGHRVSRSEVVAALSEGFGLALNLEWTPGELSTEERTTAALLRAKYAGAESQGAP
jgi:lipoate-protein ligase A